MRLRVGDTLLVASAAGGAWKERGEVTAIFCYSGCKESHVCKHAEFLVQYRHEGKFGASSRRLHQATRAALGIRWQRRRRLKRI